MRQTLYAGALLACAAILSGAAAGQGSASAAPAPRVEQVEVRGSGDALEVEINTTGASVSPDTQSITGPDRIVVDFPGALPAAQLHALKVNRGPLKGVRSGLFFNDPPITRIVLDLSSPQSYRIATTDHSVIVKLGAAQSTPATIDESADAPHGAAHGARLQNAALSTSMSTSVIVEDRRPVAPRPNIAPPEPAKPLVTVNFENGLLQIHAAKATLAQVLFEVQKQTRAEIAIPSGAELEQVVADIGPASARDVLSSLLNGSSYNFIFVGTEERLQQVILSRRDSNPY